MNISPTSNPKLRARAVVGETELHDWQARCLTERTPACKRVYLADEADREIERLRTALARVERWFGEFPPSGRTWEDGRPMSYGVAFGSNGERDYMRQVASNALSGEPTSAVETGDARLLTFSKYILQHCNYHRLRDHACPRCMPEGGELVKTDFVCAYHQAKDYAEQHGWTDPRASGEPA